MENFTVNEDEHHLFNKFEPFLCVGRPTEKTLQIRFLSASNFFLSFTAALGNILILVALSKISSLHPSSKILYRCLATTDLCVGMVAQPLFAVQLLFRVDERRFLCYIALRMCYCSGVILCGVSMTTLTAISVDRLLALQLALRYRQVVTSRRVRGLVIFFWIASVFVSTTYFWNDFITLTASCSAPLLCLLTSGLSYARMYVSLRQHHVQIGVQNRTTVLNITRYRRTVSSALFIQIGLVICYLPYGVVSAKLITSGLKSALIFPFAISYCLLLFNSSLNSLLYCWKMRNVRQAVKNTIRQFLHCFL